MQAESQGFFLRHKKSKVQLSGKETIDVALVLVTQLCLTLYDPMNCSLPCSSVHGILQARILEWVAISSSKRASRPMAQTWISYIANSLSSESPGKSIDICV